MVEFKLSVYKNADKILEDKGLLQEIVTILQDIKNVDHKEIQAKFYNKGWTLERQIFTETSWAWDAYKDKVAVSVELSLIDAVHRDFLRAILAQKRGDLDVLVYVASTFREPKFHNVKRDIEIFEEILNFPILLVGLNEDKGYTDPELQRFLREVIHAKERPKRTSKRKKIPKEVTYV